MKKEADPAALGESGKEAADYFGRELLAWYEANKRDLPWRANQDPYRIWVSEIMLQQTRVDTVIPYYQRFMDKFPTIRDLAEAPEEEVLKLWEGLGYYSRARNLQAGAKEVVRLYGGIVPDDKTAVAGLKGVGPYTAGAIMSIAFNRPEPAVDGNVMRVLSRYFLLEGDVAKPSVRTGIERLAAAIIPEGRARDFNQAVMELGALICTPKSPGCLLCPVVEGCLGRAAGRELELPIKTKAKPPRPEVRLAALVEGSGAAAGKVLVRRRPVSGLLARMWELPHVKLPDGAGAEPPARFDALSRGLAGEAGLLVRPDKLRMTAEHVFSHIRWSVEVYDASFGFFLDAGVSAGEGSPLAALPASAACEAAVGNSAGEAGAEAAANAADAAPLPDGWRWIGPEDMDTLAFPNVFMRILGGYFASRGG